MSLTKMALAFGLLPAIVVAPAATASADTGTVVPLRGILRSCDYNAIPDRSSTNRGTASAVVRTSGGSATADVHFAEPSAPGAHYDVALIQIPRASNAPCDGPGPGVAVASLDTDGAGVGNTTVSARLQPGATGVWVFIRQPSPISQSPAEFYTSDFPVKV